MLGLILITVALGAILAAGIIARLRRDAERYSVCDTRPYHPHR